MTLVDGILAVTVLAGLALNAGAGLWWADPLTALVIVSYAQRQARALPFQARRTRSTAHEHRCVPLWPTATPSKVYPSARGPFM